MAELGVSASPVDEALVRELVSILGEETVLTGGDVDRYLTDATEAQSIRGTASAVVLPENVEQVVATMRWAFENDVPVVPRGGGSGYAGGCVPNGGVVLSSERLRAIRQFEPLAWEIEIEAGLTTRDVQRLARENGLYYPVDPGAAEQSHIGGNVATNAGGPHAFKYGVTRDWVIGVEAVTVAGELLRIGGPIRKDVAGYDLRSLLCGSEGTLAFITAVTLRLIPAIPARLPVVGFHERAEDVADAVTASMASGVVPSAIEYLDAEAVRISLGSFPGPKPSDGSLMTIVEADGTPDEARVGREAIREALEEVASAVWVPDEREVDELWRWREGVGLLVDGHLGGKMSEDVVVPLAHLGEIIETTCELGWAHQLGACSWGHAGDGNVHSTFMFDRKDDDAVRRAEVASEELFEAAISFGGSVSGEHGIGTVKSGQLSKQWSAEAVRLHGTIKDSFDPKGLLNPGKKLP